MTNAASLTRRVVPTLFAAVLALSLLPAGAVAGTDGATAGLSAPVAAVAIPASPGDPAWSADPAPAVGAVSDPSPSPVPSATPAPDPSATPSPTATPTPTAAPTPTPTLTPAPTSMPAVAPVAPPAPAADPTPTPTPTPAPTPTVAMSQRATSYDATANTARVSVTATPSGFVAPWQYALAVRGAVVSSGTSSAASVTVTLTNNCSITTQSLTVSITDGSGHTAGAAATLDRSLCPPPPNVPHARDRILAGPTLTENSFVDRLRAVSSPALAEGRTIYRTMIAGGVNPAFALGTFHAESHSGTRGYAVTTKNWGNILYYSWEAAYGAVPYAPGNGYTYAKYPTWLASVQAYVALLGRYDASGYTTVSSASAHWLGTTEGSSRHLTYLNNITAVMSILPDDAVPSMTSLTVPSKSAAAVTVKWTAKDNLGVTGYQVRSRLGTGAWSAAQAATGAGTVITLASGTWTIGVRATDAASNWSTWRTATVIVDAVVPTMTALSASGLVRSTNGLFTASWSARDNVGATAYQWRLKRNADGTWGAATGTTARSRVFKLIPGSWYVGVRARDAVGNWSDWREIRVIVPRDDRAFAFSSGMVRRTGPSYFRGTVTTTSRAGSKLTTTFTGTGFYLVGTAGPAYGRMRVTIDGTSWVVDAGTYAGRRATSNHYRAVLFSRSLAAGSHSVTIVNLATSHRATIAVDALGFAN